MLRRCGLLSNGFVSGTKGDAAEKLDKIFNHYMPLLIQTENIVSQDDRAQLEVQTPVVSIFISMILHSDDPEDEWAVHDRAIYRLKSDEFEPHTRVVAFKKLAEVLDEPEVDVHLGEFRRECAPCAFLVPNDNMTYRLPPEAYGLDGTLLGYDYTYTNAPPGIIFIDDDTDGEDEPESSAPVEFIGENAAIVDRNEQNGIEETGQSSGSDVVNNLADQINGDRSNQITYLEENNTLATHAAPSLPTCSALDDDRYAECIAVKRMQTNSIPSVLNEKWCRARVIRGDLSSVIVHVRLEEDGIQNATVDARKAFGFRDHETMVLRHTTRKPGDFYPALEMLGFQDVSVENLMHSRAFPVPLAPVFNLLLGGFCGLRPARWILCAIYTGIVKVSVNSPVSFIPQALRSDSEDAIQVTCSLSREVAGAMGVLVPKSRRAAVENRREELDSDEATDFSFELYLLTKSSRGGRGRGDIS